MATVGVKGLTHAQTKANEIKQMKLMPSLGGF